MNQPTNLEAASEAIGKAITLLGPASKDEAQVVAAADRIVAELDKMDPLSFDGEYRSEEGQLREANHTPGPWHVQPYVDAIDIHARDGSVVAHVADRSLASTGMPPDNARLVAAAPDMLEALQAVCDGSAPLMQSEIWKKIRDAIAKATGTTP